MQKKTTNKTTNNKWIKGRIKDTSYAKQDLFPSRKNKSKSSQYPYTIKKTMMRLCLDSWLDTTF